MEPCLNAKTAHKDNAAERVMAQLRALDHRLGEIITETNERLGCINSRQHYAAYAKEIEGELNGSIPIDVATDEDTPPLFQGYANLANSIERRVRLIWAIINTTEIG